jgi:hypothetical protein
LWIILAKYEEGTGQMVNKVKWFKFFSSGSEVVVSARIIPGVGTSGGEM